MKTSGGNVLHTDEGVLHSYLDGALRSDERLEVESHIAGCVSCAVALREARQLKSQATKILSRARPPRVVNRPRSLPDRRRRRPLVTVAWAASVAIALAAGWTARAILRQQPGGPLAAASIEQEIGTLEGAALSDATTRTDSGLSSAAAPVEPTRTLAEAPRTQEQRGTRRSRRSPTAREEEPAMAKAAAPPPVPPAEQIAAEPLPRADLRVIRLPEPDRQEARNAAQADEVKGAVGRAAAPAAAAPGTERSGYPGPLAETLPGYSVVDVKTGLNPQLVVTQISSAGDTVVLVYAPTAAPDDDNRIFDQGIVLERDATGRPRNVVGRYRIVGNYRITALATGGISRDSLGTLLDLLEVRELR